MTTRTLDMANVIASDVTIAGDKTLSGDITFSGDVIPSTPLSHRNKIINGNFDIWQRGTTFNSSTSTAHYSADRWAYYNYQQGSTTVVTRQAFTVGQTDVPGEPKYYLRHTLGSSNQEWWVYQRIEDVHTFAGQTATLSLWMKSSSAQTVRLRLHQNFGSGGSSIVYSSTTDCSVTTSWTKFTATITPASISGKTIGTSSYLSADIGSLGATAVASSSVDIAQVQLELGDNATPFEHRTLQDELLRCQRYFYMVGGDAGDDPAGASGHQRNYIVGRTSNTNAMYCAPPSAVPMRSTPTVGNFLGSFNINCINKDGATNLNTQPTVDTYNNGKPGNTVGNMYLSGGSGLTDGRVCCARINAPITFDSEL